MREKYSWAPTLNFDGTVTCADQDGIEHKSSVPPQTIADKANKLLEILIKRTTFFGEIITLKNKDYGLGYAKSEQEFRSFLDFLETQGKISQTKTMHTVGVKVSAEALDSLAELSKKNAAVSKEMRILFLAANPTTTLSLDLEEELRSLQRELTSATYREQITCVAGHAVRPDDLIRHVRDVRPNVVHFSGHGDSGGILLRDESGVDVTVSGSSLERFFKDRDVELVVLNSCYSEQQAKSIRNSVKAVVATSDAVDDAAARRFTTAFYRALGNGFSIKEAFRDGGDAVDLHGLENVFICDGELTLKFVGK
jgi:hypothetical protein